MARRSAQDVQARARKAFARRQRARRWLTWRYVLAAVLLVGLLGFGVYALYFSAWLRADGVELVGNSQLTDEEVLRAAAVDTGGPLATVDLDAIARRIRTKMPTVKTVDVSRKWPHDVRIEVVERKPIAVVEIGSQLYFLDADGKHFRPHGQAPKKTPAGLPRVKVGPGADDDALQEGARVVAVLDEDVATMLDFLEVRTVDQILLHLRDGREVRWGSADLSDDKARVLLLLLHRKARVYDVSVPGQPTTR
ncbi:MAG TPA: FtsQ-type POTRA domain-containing protein [Nocardioides sp.]|nr:FtsQ-type POTRA domain-containing protein [Nocardioides sp.]